MTRRPFDLREAQEYAAHAHPRCPLCGERVGTIGEVCGNCVDYDAEEASTIAASDEIEAKNARGEP